MALLYRTEKPLRSNNPFGLTTTGVLMYHYSKEEGTDSWLDI